MNKRATIDFDNTLVNSVWPGLGPPIPGAKEALEELKKDGWEIYKSIIDMEKDQKYDSALDTLKHKQRVNSLLQSAAIELLNRGEHHDDSKLGDLEKPDFDRLTPILKDLKYGTPEYKKSLNELQGALTQHYENNSHHPEHYDNGVNGFDLFDLVEMFFDWKAATERTKDGDIYKSLEINKDRFHLSDQVYSIFKNTANLLNY